MELFEYGANWLRTDFHLHTKADAHFCYDEDEDYYYSSYIDALAKAGIRVGIIANHNKFDFIEFSALRKTAHRQEIYLLPGVELSLNDGSNGVHMIIVFSDDWIRDGNEEISSFLHTLFPGIPENKRETGQSPKNILQVVEALDESSHDYFLIFPHVEDRKGLWYNAEGGRFLPWRESLYKPVIKRTLAFEKVATRDKRDNVKKWLGDWYPAEVIGSDPKNIGQIGQKTPTYLKLGAFTFESIKLALHPKSERVSVGEIPTYVHSYIKQIHFDGGILDGKTIRFSPELNTLIGIRGSGKSSVLEAMRYAMGIPLDERSNDYKYKRALVDRTLDSGGKTVIEAIDRHGQLYEIRRIYNDLPEVCVGGKLQPGVSIRETVLHQPLYFGQKELASDGDVSEKVLIEKLLGTKCSEIRARIKEQKSKVDQLVVQLSKINNVDELLAEQTNIIKDTEFRLQFYRVHNLEEKLKKRLGFNKDLQQTAEGVELVKAFIESVRELLAYYEDELRNFLGYSSTVNAEFFQDYYTDFFQAIKSVDIIKQEANKLEVAMKKMIKAKQKLELMEKNLEEEFASVERLLAAELKTNKGQSISIEEFVKLQDKLESAKRILSVLKKSSANRDEIESLLKKELSALNDLWHEEFRLIKGELDEVSKKNAALKFSAIYKGDKDAFFDYFQTVFSGSNMRKAAIQKLVDEYSDFISIYADFENTKKAFGSNADKISERFIQELRSLLLYQVPNKYKVTYHGTELAHHSLGQRASALMLFVLGQRENDVIIIDQPEDDLDSKTVYEDVIKLIQELKPSVQFIFATHNPNITVLGDAEQIHVCTYSDDTINVQSGALDDTGQQKLIVDIMEGGDDAFKRRKEIYETWKP